MCKKDRLFIVLLFLTFTGSAQNSSDYIVKTVTGKVRYESAPNIWTYIKKEQRLTPSSVLNIGPDSILILIHNGNTIVLNPMQKGTVENLLLDADSGKNSLTKGADVTKSNIQGENAETKKGVSTASSRADEADNGPGWEEE